MTADPWTTLAAVEPASLRDALLEVHWAAQVIASAGQTFVEPRADDSHRSMTWNAGLHGFVGEPFAGAYPFRVFLRPGDLVLGLVDRTDQALGSLPLAGLTHDDAYAWLATGLATYMGGPQAIGRPEYEIPAHPLGEGSTFAKGRDAERAAIAALYGSAAALLEELAGARTDASAVRCWPHHFDIATLLTVAPALGETPARTVGIGMAPMGGGYDDWYWYVTPWPYPDAGGLPALAAPAAWHTEGWTGAVLTGASVVAAPDGERHDLVRGFATEAIGASLLALGR